MYAIANIITGKTSKTSRFFHTIPRASRILVSARDPVIIVVEREPKDAVDD